MPPRYVYWTIIAGGLPTAFRAAKQDDLLPTFMRIKGKHPDAEMKWFARGKLWNSEEESRAPRSPGNWREARNPSASRGASPRPASTDRPAAPARKPVADATERRGRTWRPGGEHRDPRQPFKDAKKAKNQDRRQQRWDRKQHAPTGARTQSDRPPDARAFEKRPPAHSRRDAAHKPTSSGRDAAHKPAFPDRSADRKPAWSPKPPASRPFRPRASGGASPGPRDRGPRRRS